KLSHFALLRAGERREGGPAAPRWSVSGRRARCSRRKRSPWATAGRSSADRGLLHARWEADRGAGRGAGHRFPIRTGTGGGVGDGGRRVTIVVLRLRLEL